jgi:hypothetical protein
VVLSGYNSCADKDTPKKDTDSGLPCTSMNIMQSRAKIIMSVNYLVVGCDEGRARIKVLSAYQGNPKYGKVESYRL